MINYKMCKVYISFFVFKSSYEVQQIVEVIKKAKDDVKIKITSYIKIFYRNLYIY